MSIKSVNLYGQNKYYCTNQRSLAFGNQSKTVDFLNSAVSNPVLNQDTFEYSSTTIQSANSSIIELKNKFQAIKDEQGWIAKPVDWFKNLFNTKNCSNNIEIAINNLNEDSTKEEFQAVEEMLNKYTSNQDSAVKGVVSTAAMMTGGAVGAKFGAAIGTAICPGLGTIGGFLCGIVVGAFAGAVTNIFVNQVENMTDNVEHNEWFEDENLLKEAGEGALAGGSAVLMGGITQKVTGAVASKVGLSSVNYGGKTALVTLAEDGVTAKVGATVAKNAFASAIGSGTAAATVSCGTYALECAFDKDKDFSLADFGTTTATSFAFGGLIGGVTGGVQGYKGATSNNAYQTQIKAKYSKIRNSGKANEYFPRDAVQNHGEKPAMEAAKDFGLEIQQTDQNGNVISTITRGENGEFIGADRYEQTITRYDVKAKQVVYEYQDASGSPAKYSKTVETRNPIDIAFSQSTVGDSVEGISSSMGISGYEGVPLDVVELPNGRLVSIDNRRLLAARNAGLTDVPIVIHSASERLTNSEIDRFNAWLGGNIEQGAKTWGEALRDRMFRNNLLGETVPLVQNIEVDLKQTPVIGKLDKEIQKALTKTLKIFLGLE